MAADDLTAHAPLADAITVVIAVRNGMPYVIEAVRSALGQGVAVDRVVVVDDGSDDETHAAVSTLKELRVSGRDEPRPWRVPRPQCRRGLRAHALAPVPRRRRPSRRWRRRPPACGREPRSRRPSRSMDVIAVSMRTGRPLGHPFVAGLRRMVSGSRCATIREYSRFAGARQFHHQWRCRDSSIATPLNGSVASRLNCPCAKTGISGAGSRRSARSTTCQSG